MSGTGYVEAEGIELDAVDPDPDDPGVCDYQCTDTAEYRVTVSAGGPGATFDACSSCLQHASIYPEEFLANREDLGERTLSCEDCGEGHVPGLTGISADGRPTCVECGGVVA